MADIPGNLDKMNDLEIAFEASLSEQLFNKIGANINALIDGAGNTNVFTSGGTLNVPENLSEVFVLACGGGGGGGTGNNGSFAGHGHAAQGGSSSLLYLNKYSVTALETLTIAVGTGGAGATSPPTAVGVAGAAGGNSSVTGLAGTLTYYGARGGFGSTSIGANIGAAVFRTATILEHDANELYGQVNTIDLNGGGVQYRFYQRSANYISTLTGTNVQNGGSGAPSDFGPGGTGGTIFANGSNASATSYGAGGGGGGQKNASGNGNGGNGADGIVIVFW